MNYHKFHVNAMEIVAQGKYKFWNFLEFFFFNVFHPWLLEPQIWNLKRWKVTILPGTHPPPRGPQMEAWTL